MQPGPVRDERLHPSLEATDLEFAYDDTPVLRKVSAAIVPRQFTALVGPNGSGKSTLLAALARFLKPSAGLVRLEQQPIGRMPTKAVARRLALLPQNPPLPDGMTVFELVARGRYPHLGFLGLWSERDLEAVHEAIALTGMRDFAERQVSALSGGQRQRCWVAMALAQETPILLLDEPTSALDLRYQLEVLDLLRRLTTHHDRTVVVAMHDLNLAASHADQMIFFRDGVIHGAGPTETVCSGSVIEAVFGVKVTTLINPATGRPVFVPELADTPFDG